MNVEIAQNATTRSSQALRLCDEHDLPFDRLFRYQYVISDAELELPSFQARRVGDFILQTGKDLHLSELIDRDGVQIGYVFGQAVTHDGRSLSELVQQEFCSAIDGSKRLFEDILVETIGRYGILVKLNNAAYFYQDASGTIGAVINSDLRRVASSLNLCLDLPSDRSSDFVTEDQKARLCGCGLHFTEDDAVVRINPSYCFDLSRWNGARFWPREADTFEHGDENYSGVLDQIIHAVRSVCHRLTTENSVTLSLSGGYDSRAIYAISDVETRERFEQIFVAVHNKIGWYDAMVASAVCDLDGLGIEIHQTARPRRLRPKSELEQERLAFSIASGKTGNVPIETQLGSYSKINDNAIVMRGQQIPILKALFVRSADPESWTADFIVERVTTLLGSTNAPAATQHKIENAARNLYAEFPAKARARIVDLLLMEAVNGPELAEMFTGFSHAFYLSPFNSRRVVQLLAGFHTEHRADLSTFHHLLMRADSRTCGLATTGEVKQVKGLEEDEGLIARFERVRKYKKSYHERAGESAPAVQFRRFSTFGASRLESTRALRQKFLSLKANPRK